MLHEPTDLHFSIDDVLDCLLTLDPEQTSLFDHWFFDFLRRLHDDFGICIDLYLFYRRPAINDHIDLSSVSNRFFDEFEANPWLRLGYHALDYDTPPYQQQSGEQVSTFSRIEHEIVRFAGRLSRSPSLRLHHFSETYDITDYFHNNGIGGLLLTDKDAIAYHLPEPQRQQLGRDGYTHYRGLDLYRSHARVENLSSDACSDNDIKRYFQGCMDRHGYVALFTHEYELVNSVVREQTFTCLRILSELGLRLI